MRGTEGEVPHLIAQPQRGVFDVMYDAKPWEKLMSRGRGDLTGVWKMPRWHLCEEQTGVWVETGSPVRR